MFSSQTSVGLHRAHGARNFRENFSQVLTFGIASLINSLDVISDDRLSYLWEIWIIDGNIAQVNNTSFESLTQVCVKVAVSSGFDDILALPEYV